MDLRDELLTTCTSSCPWEHSAVEGPGSRCDSWCHSHHTAVTGPDLWLGHKLRTQYTPNNASLYLAPPYWSGKSVWSIYLFFFHFYRFAKLIQSALYEMNSKKTLYLYANTERMIALATLSAGQKTTLCTEAKTPTHHTHVLNRTNQLWPALFQLR